MSPDRHSHKHHVARHYELANTKTDADNRSSKKQTARRRAYAKRSCLKCREKKARCELPQESLTTPSSMIPLSDHLACHRCKVLSLDCVVWDGDRKRRPKVPSADANTDEPSASSTSIKSEAGGSRQPSSPPRSPGSLEQLAAAAARLSDQRTTYDDAPDMSPHGASSNDAFSSREAASTLASVQFFNPVVNDVATPSMSAPSPVSARTLDRSRLSSCKDYTASSARAKIPPAASISSANSASSATSSKMQPPGRTWTSLWRPLSVLIDYAAQQPSFTSYLLSRIDPNLKNLDILDLIPRQTLSYLKPLLRPYLLWHPHLPGLDHIYAEHCKRPTISSALLLSSMCLVACRHAMPLTDSLPTKLSTLVDQLGTQILLSTPRDMYTVQALELLLAHEPSLVGTSVAGFAQAERGNGLLGESLLAAALTIARGLDLDKSVDNVIDLCRRPPPADEAQARQRREILAKHLAGASIWLGLRIWEGHFSFVNSTVRPIELGQMPDKADIMVAIDNDGRKIERMERDPFLSTEKRFPGLDEDSILRSAGRTGLVYRLKAMARFQDTIAGMYRILATGTKPEETTPETPTPTTQETRQKILELLTTSSHKQLFWQSAKTRAFSPFASVRPALLLEDWATMESYSFQELLPCLAICGFMTGELNRGFSANEMVEALRIDESFRTQSTFISERRDVETHAMLSSFHLFDRGLSYSQPDILTRGGPPPKVQRGSLWIEATGAPLMLTTAFATDGCKTFLEKTACSLYGFDHLPVTVDMHLVMMVHTLHRLEECDRNEYLPPIRPKRSSIPRPSSPRMPNMPLDLDSKGNIMPGRSISQIGVIFIEEMVQVMQKWKLGVSLQRTVPYHFRHIFAKQNTPSTKHAVDSPSQKPINIAKQSPRMNLQSHQAPGERRNPTSAPSSTLPENNSDGSLGQAQSFSQSFQSSFIPGLPQQPNPTAAAGGNGGMFDIPMFDLFGPASATDWTNNVPWFDPIESAASTSAPLPSLADGQSNSQWEQYPQQPTMPTPLQNTWSATQRQRIHDTLPPLQYTSAQLPPPLPSQTQQSQSHSYNSYGSGNGYSGYSASGSGSSQTFGSAKGGDHDQSHPTSNGSHQQQHQQQQEQQQHYQHTQHQHQHQQYHRPYYNGGGIGNHHGSR
ncbi:uncharacterized protein MEPE_06213 [Melanopsichium pennsylvanicum]|uniref:Zn(2)-C6 fungal-type domain-containing protein n=2 Tax=Melanopsichium pennsylvanicum TaxID=63383 RepID=A0AAJ4XU50_9BASI